MEESNPRKRPRPVVSCLRCREKKLKCDRTTPCENCVKAQQSHTCMYNQNATTPTSKETVSNPSRKLATTVEEMQRRLNRVEEMLGISPDVADKDTVVETSSPNLLGTVVVKGTRTVYHGQNDRTTLLNQFLDIKSFISTMSSDPKIAASAKQVKFLQNRSQAAKVASPGSEKEPEFSLALLKLKEFLPPRTFCDRLVDVYCQNFERTMRVLHIPTFKREYESIWQGSSPGLCTTSSIIPQLTAVMAMAYHMDSPFQTDKTEQSYRTYLKSAANDLIQAWLDELGRKQRTELATLQVEILLLLSRSLKGMYPEKLWAATGALVRSAVVMGLNMNPALLTAMKPYHVEMRKRIWATVLEIDLQASMTCGMPLVVPELDPASIQPANLNDTDFDEDATVLPVAPSLDTYTDNLYQVTLAASLPARLKAQSLVQRSAPAITQAASIGREIEAAIANKPALLSLHTTSPALPSDAGALLHRVLLDLYLRRPLLCLYKPLLHAPYDSNSTAHAAMHRYCLDCSQAILTYQDLYTISSLNAVTSSPQAHQNFFYRCCKMDILWAALALCQHIKQLHARGETDTDEVRGLIGTVETTVACLVNRIEHRGSDIKDIVFLALVLKSVQIPDCAPDREEQLRGVVQETLETCRGVLLQSIVVEQDGSKAHVAGWSNGEMARGITVPAVEGSMAPAESMILSTGLLEMAEQWSTDLPGLDIDFSTFQAEMGNSGDALNFGVAQDWNWEHLWQ